MIFTTNPSSLQPCLQIDVTGSAGASATKPVSLRREPRSSMIYHILP